MNDRKKTYKQRFREQWKNIPHLKGWLQPGSVPDKAYCTYCKTTLNAHFRDLTRHSKSEKHKEYAALVSPYQMEFITISENGDVRPSRKVPILKLEDDGMLKVEDEINENDDGDGWSFFIKKSSPKRGRRSDSSVSSGSQVSLNEKDLFMSPLKIPVNDPLQASDLKEETSKPLAETMRPHTMQQFVGHEEIFGPSTLLRSNIQETHLSSMIIWGPPGCGKTTLACIIGQQCRASTAKRFVTLSSCSSGIQEINSLIQEARMHDNMGHKRTIVFVDEVHRLSKSEQDVFLSHMESGLITVIGATTEDPSTLNTSLLSRCLVIALEPLSPKHIRKILQRALRRLSYVFIREVNTGEKCLDYSSSEEASLQEMILSGGSHHISIEAVRWLSEACKGDARVALNTLEVLVTSTAVEPVLQHHVKAALQGNYISDLGNDTCKDYEAALQKSIVGADDNAAVYWTMRLIHSGEDHVAVAKKLIQIAAEDVGIGDLNALNVAVSTLEAVKAVGPTGSDAILAQCAVYLARTSHNPEVNHAVMRIKEHLSNYKGHLPPVPVHLSSSSDFMMDLGYATSQLQIVPMEFLPEELGEVNFFCGQNSQ